MSVKFQEEVTRTMSGAIPGGDGLRDGLRGALPGGNIPGLPGLSGGPGAGLAGAAAAAAGVGGLGAAAEGIKRAVDSATAPGDGKIKHPVMHEVGELLTQGGGPGGYLAAYITQLQKNPMRTKMLTSGTLAGLQEFLASWIAHDKNQYGNYFTSRVPKMAIYGAFVSAPMGHVLINLLQWTFKGRTSLKAKIMQILASNLIIAPIQNAVYLVAMAIIAGARTFHQVRATVRAGFWTVMRVSWLTSPLCLAFAQAFLPQETWVPFFNFISFVIGTYINSHTKKKRLAALRRKHYGDGRGGSVAGSSRTEYKEYKEEYSGPARPGY